MFGSKPNFCFRILQIILNWWGVLVHVWWKFTNRQKWASPPPSSQKSVRNHWCLQYSSESSENMSLRVVFDELSNGANSFWCDRALSGETAPKYKSEKVFFSIISKNNRRTAMKFAPSFSRFFFHFWPTYFFQFIFCEILKKRIMKFFFKMV